MGLLCHALAWVEAMGATMGWVVVMCGTMPRVTVVVMGYRRNDGDTLLASFFGLHMVRGVG